MCKDQIIFKLNCVFVEYIVHNHFILAILTLVEKVILNAQISERQNKIGIIFSPSADRKYIEIKKEVKELELTDLNVSKSLLSSNCTYILLLPQECSHSRPVM